MRTVLALLTIVFAAGCRDEVAVTLDEIEVVQQEILALLDQRVQEAAQLAATAATAMVNARTAFENAPLAPNPEGVGHRARAEFRCPEFRAPWNNEVVFGSDNDDWKTKATLCTAWQERQREERDAGDRHQQAQRALSNRTHRYDQQLASFRRAHDDDTWDLMGPPGATARSIVIARLRELQDERTRLEDLAAEAHP